MAKHIHIHLPVRTKDAGFDESKHKRDHGKFAATPGGVGDPKFHEANYHKASAKNKELFAKAKGAQGPNHPATLANHSQATAAEHHSAAARAAHRGNVGLAASHHAAALEHEGYAAKHEAATPKPQLQSSKTAASLNHQEWQSAVQQHHPDAAFHKNEKGHTIAKSKGNLVGSFVAPGSHFVKKPEQPQTPKYSYTGEDPMVMETLHAKTSSYSEKSDVVNNEPKMGATPPRKPAPNNLYDKPKNSAFQPGQKEMESHPNYNKDDHEYLKGKGWTNSEIHQRWTAEQQAGKGAQKVNKHNPPSAFGLS